MQTHVFSTKFRHPKKYDYHLWHNQYQRFMNILFIAWKFIIFKLVSQRNLTKNLHSSFNVFFMSHFSFSLSSNFSKSYCKRSYPKYIKLFNIRKLILPTMWRYAKEYLKFSTIHGVSYFSSPRAHKIEK